MTIGQWFENGCPYSEGVELYKQFGKSDNLKELFKNENAWNKNKLHYELSKLVHLSPVPEAPVSSGPEPAEPTIPTEAVSSGWLHKIIMFFKSIFKR